MSPMRHAAIFLLLSLPLTAQQGNRQGHNNMSPVVPAAEVPAAPVLDPPAALRSYATASGFKLETVAAEPIVEKPVCLDFDPAGRLWVCEMNGYMPDIDGKLESDPRGSIVVLEDTNRDGRYDRRTIFLEKLLLPRAIAVFEDGILFIDETRLCWTPREGTKTAGETITIDARFAAGGNVEHKPNGLLRNLDNRLYLAKSDKRIRRDGNSWVLEPTAFRGQWGIARDDWGRLHHNNNSTFLFGDLLAPNLLQGNPGTRMKYRDFTQLGSNRVWPIRVTPGINRAYMDRRNGYSEQTLDPKTHKLISATAAAGMAIYRGTNFPSSWRGTALVTEPSVHLVKAIRIEEKDGKTSGTHVFPDSEILASTDERARPVHIYNAPDGSLLVLDMYHGIIQHKTFMTSYLREQTLARKLDQPGYGHGRIYRLRSTSGKLEAPIDLTTLDPLALVKMLMHENAWHREMAQRLMVDRADPAVIPFLTKLTAAGPARARAHAIWTLEGMGRLEATHLASALRADHAELQASALWAATRLSPDQLAKLTPILLKIEVPETNLPYLARTLGSTGQPAAFSRLRELLDQHPRHPFLRQAVASGLDHHEKDFIAAAMKDSRDKELLGWLEQAAADANTKPAGPALTGAALAAYQRGRTLYHGEAACFGCHGADGAGLPNLGPPLAESEWVTGKPETLIRILLHGMSGPVEVAGQLYTPPTDMPGLSFNPAMTDTHISDIATYIRNEWGNRAPAVTDAQVTRERTATRDRSGRPWKAQELK